MKKLIIRISYFGLLTAMMTLMMSSFVFASAATSQYTNKLNEIATSIKGIATALVVVSAIVTSILYMSSFANAHNRDRAKLSLYALVVGVFMLAMYSEIAGWIYGLIGKDPANLPTAMNTNAGKTVKSVTYSSGDKIGNNQ